MNSTTINIISALLIPAIILLVLICGLMKKVPIYETFIDGSKDGLKIAVDVLPNLIAIIVAISMLRASGFIDICQNMFTDIFTKLNIPIDVLPVMIVRSLSGSAVLGLFSEIATQNGPDSYATKLAAIMIGSSETTFYVLAVYFGSVGIKKFRHALLSGILADIIGIISAIIIARWLFL